MLHVMYDQPVLRIKRLNVLEKGGTPMGYAITRFRADMIQLRIDLGKKPIKSVKVKI